VITAVFSDRTKVGTLTAVLLVAAIFLAVSPMASVEATPPPGLSIALFKNVDPWADATNEAVLSFYGIPYTILNSSHMGRVDLSWYSKVVIASDQNQAFYDAMNTSNQWFEDYVSRGGVLEIHAADLGWNGGSWVGLLPGGLQWNSSYGDAVTIVDLTHPVVRAPNQITDAELDGWLWSVHGYFGDTYPPESRIVITEDSTDLAAYLEFDYGLGHIVASSQPLEYAYQNGYSLILENSLVFHSQRETIDVQLDVGTIHFRGEIAEFYVQTALNGISVNATITGATLIHSEGTASVDLTTSVEYISIGLYRIPYMIPADADIGTYVLVIDIHTHMRDARVCARGTASKSFLISSTLTSENALITDIKDEIATVIMPDLGAIKADLNEINARIIEIDGKIATIQTDIGTMKTDLSNINAKVTSIEGDTATIETDVGTVQTSLDNIEELVGGIDETTTPTYWFSLASTILAALATVIAIIVVVLVKKKPA
jgi:hypothetical protein